MKHILQASTLLLLGLALCATMAPAAPNNPPPTLAVDCQGNFYPGTTNCLAGAQILITGENFPASVIVSVISPDGIDIDGGRYHTNNGHLESFQTPGVDGEWTVTVRRGKAVLATTTFREGPDPAP